MIKEVFKRDRIKDAAGIRKIVNVKIKITGWRSLCVFSFVEEMSAIYKNTRESVSQISVCNEGERKRERGKLRRKAETLYHVFSERQTRKRENARVKRTKEGEKGRNGAHREKERA